MSFVKLTGNDISLAVGSAIAIKKKEIYVSIIMSEYFAVAGPTISRYIDNTSALNFKTFPIFVI